jgi:hypothetical protein
MVFEEMSKQESQLEGNTYNDPLKASLVIKFGV